MLTYVGATTYMSEALHPYADVCRYVCWRMQVATTYMSEAAVGTVYVNQAQRLESAGKLKVHTSLRPHTLAA